MGNSESTPKPETRSIAIPTTPVIKCDHVFGQIEHRGDFTERNTDQRGFRQWETNKLSSLVNARKSPSLASNHDHHGLQPARRNPPPGEMDVTAGGLEPAAPLLARRPSAIQLPAVTIYGGDEHQKTMPSVLETPVSPIYKPSNEPGLTGVARHKPLPQFHPADGKHPGLSKRPGSPSPTQRHSRPPNKAHSPSLSRPRPPKSRSGPVLGKASPEALFHHQHNSPVTKLSQPAQNRRIQLEYATMGLPQTRKQSPSPSRAARKVDAPRSNLLQNSTYRGPGIPRSRLEYTFYIRDTDDQRKPFDDNSADAIARGCQCTIELITLQKGSPPVFHKGQRVCPVTIATTNMINLRKCLARLDTQFPHFNARAFFPH